MAYLYRSADQSALYAFFDLGRANTGNFGIAVALASTNAMIRSNLESALTKYPNKEEVWKLPDLVLLPQFISAADTLISDNP